jgi:hypothetical protein
MNESIDRATISPHIETKVSPRQTSALGGAPITGTKIPSKRKLAVTDVSLSIIYHLNKIFDSSLGFS